jgi:very-short-patch-repair endonuclease
VSTSSGVSFDRLCVSVGLPRPLPEYHFAASRGRAWRFDWCWPDAKLAIEIDGGGFVRGRHHRAAGFAEDCLKLNTAIVEGWRVLRATPQQVADGSALDFVRQALLR